MSDFSTKLKDWMAKQGYPLEFQTATAIRQTGGDAQQGIYVEVDGKPREIDVVYEKQLRTSGSRQGIFSHVFECKSGRDKPWIVLSHHDFSVVGRRDPTHLIASEAADACMWRLATENDAGDLPIFRGGLGHNFSAVRAFSEQDICYTAIQSVIAKTAALAKSHNSPNPQYLPGDAFIGFPVIVIDSPLFIALYNEDTEAMEMHEHESAELFWRGSNDWDHPVVIDIVTIKHLREWLIKRKHELAPLQKYVQTHIPRIYELYADPVDVSHDDRRIYASRPSTIDRDIPRLGQRILRNAYQP